jgi:adenosine deaminase
MSRSTELPLAKIQAFPKIDLHRHLLGSVRPATLWDLALRYNLALGQKSLEEFTSALVGRVSHGDLSDYISPWKLIREAIRNSEDVRRIAIEAAIDARLDGVRYVEFRNSLPGMLITDGKSPQTQIPTSEYLHAIQEGFSATPDIECRLIASVPRHAVGPATPALFERYADRFFETISGFRELIVGVDLTGVERGWPASLFKDIFAQARKMKLPITIHAGETEGPEEVWAAIDELGASRIGHGTSAPDDPRLVKELIKRNVVLEVCPTSGWLIGRLKERYRHPVIDCLPPIPYVVCTDNPILNGSTLSRELGLAVQISGSQSESFFESQVRLASQAAFSPHAEMALMTKSGQK